MGDAEVDDDGLAVLEEHVAGLEVAVHDADRVDRLQGLDEAATQAHQLVRAERPLVGDDVVQRGPGDVAGHQVGAVPHDVGVDDRGDPGADDAGERVDLALQPPAGLRVVGDVRAEHLDGHGSAVRVQPEVDDAHPTLAEARHQPVRPEPVRLGRDRVTRPFGAGGPVVERHAHHGKPWLQPGSDRSLLDVPNELVTFDLEGVDPQLDDVADADDRVERAVDHDGHVPDAHVRSSSGPRSRGRRPCWRW